MYYRRSCFIQPSSQDKEDRDQDVGSCGSLTCLVYIVCTIYARRESNSDPLLSSCVGEDAFGGGDFSEHNLPLCEIYTPSVTKEDPRETENRRPRATRPWSDRATRPERARGGPCRRFFGGGATITTYVSLRSRLGGRNEKEKENENEKPTSRRVWKERWYYFLILIKHRKPRTRRRRRRLSPARSCRWGWSSSSPGRPCARRGP